MTLVELLISLIIFAIAAAIIFAAAYGFYKSLVTYKRVEAKETLYSDMVNVAIALANKKNPSFEGVNISEATINGLPFYIISSDNASIAVLKW